jgi:tetratricopeptide (TPR) repeat protein
LGRVAAQNSDRVEAERCWQQAIDADPKYVPSYPLLALAEAGQARWPRLVEVTEAWLALDPADYAEAWYLNSVGNYFVGNLASAEQSARQGIKLDSGHRVPKLQYVLGMILIQKRAYPEAAEHIQIYLQMVTKPADVNEAQKQLAEIERLSSGVKVAGVPNRP